MTDFVLAGTWGEEERGEGGGIAVRGGWMMGKGQNLC